MDRSGCSGGGLLAAQVEQGPGNHRKREQVGQAPTKNLKSFRPTRLRCDRPRKGHQRNPSVVTVKTVGNLVRRNEISFMQMECFNCDEHGHTQHNFPGLHSMRWPTVNVASVESARQERLVKVHDSPDVRVDLITFDLEGEEDNMTNMMHLAHAFCVKEWGPDDPWYNIWTRANSRYGFYEYDTGSGLIMEIPDENRPEMVRLEVDSHRFLDLTFRLTGVHRDNANTDPLCIREGGY